MFFTLVNDYYIPAGLSVLAVIMWVVAFLKCRKCRKKVESAKTEPEQMESAKMESAKTEPEARPGMW